MKLRARNGLLFLLSTALLVLAAGCPNSTVVLSANGAAQMAVNLNNLSRFDQGFFVIDQLLVRPVDPGASAAVGTGRELNMFQVAVFVDATLPEVDPLFFSPNQLAQGTYEVIEIQMSQMFFFDTDPPDPSTCESFQTFYAPTEIFVIDSFPVPLRFTVERGVDTPVAINIDITEMISTLHDAYTCSPGCGAFCISNFDPAQFIARTGDYLTLE